MVTLKKLKQYIDAEDSAYVAYLEAHERANNARKDYTTEQLKLHGIHPNKTQVMVRNFNAVKVRAVVTHITKAGKLVCFEVKVDGPMVEPNRQAACVDLKELEIIEKGNG